ncbi:MAG TPA: DUF5615 family PIN-like protein [Bdellovibrionota bacterium]|nr:DUF5615 family PIN-like protein [Bdellovibrionota bacterium]
MKIKLDENIPQHALGIFKDAGHDVASVYVQGMSGASDVELLRVVTQEERILITFDTEFANVQKYPVGTHAGIVVFRLPDQRQDMVGDAVQRLVRSGALDRLARGIAVVSPL